MAPPELIYLVFELMKRGDLYYSKLLLDTPQIGILDLGDTTKETAQEWMKEAQDLFIGTDPMKIPVLYEHTTEVKWIPFQMKPNEMMFSEITSRYAGLICSGYGMSLSDIGMGGGSNGGETLSGTIRDERKSKRTIQAVLKKKFKSFYNRILPDTLEFAWIDFDDDQNVARGRARLANAQADEIFVRNHVYSPQELRAQGLVDGLITVSVPETLDEKNIEWPQSGNTIRPGLIGEKVSAESGGRGEISGAQDLTARALTKVVVSKAYRPIQKLIAATKDMSHEEIVGWKKRVDDALWWREPKEIVKKSQEEVVEKASNQPISVTINTPAPLVPQTSGVAVHNYLDGKPIDDPEEEARKRELLVGELSNVLKSNQAELTEELNNNLKKSQAELTDEVMDNLNHNQDVLAGNVLEHLKETIIAQSKAETVEKKIKSKSLLDAIRKLVNGK
jgi:hypothetical protein